MIARTRWTWLLLLAALAVGIGSMAAAQCAMHAQAAADAPAMMNPPGCGGPMGGKMMDPMGLSEDQQKAIQKIRTDAQDARMSTHKEMMRLRNALQGEMLKDEIDAGDVRKLVQKMGELRTQMQLQQLEQRLAIRKLLTPEQRDRAMMRMGRGGEWCPGGPRGMRGMHRMMGRGGCMGGQGGGCMGMGGAEKGCTPGPGCRGRMQAPPQGKDSSALPEGRGFEGGFAPDSDLDLLAGFDLDFGPDFDLGFDAPAAPEPFTEPMTK